MCFNINLSLSAIVFILLDVISTSITLSIHSKFSSAWQASNVCVAAVKSTI